MQRIELNAVEKRFRERRAVKKTDLCLESGVYGLLGENGAGKTTLMRMICGVLRPTGGSIRCDGIEIGQMGRAYRRLLGYLPQDFGYYGEFSARRFLRYMAALKAMPQELTRAAGKIAWKCIAGEEEAERLGSRFTVSNLRHLERSAF